MLLRAAAADAVNENVIALDLNGLFGGQRLSVRGRSFGHKLEAVSLQAVPFRAHHAVPHAVIIQRQIRAAAHHAGVIPELLADGHALRRRDGEFAVLQHADRIRSVDGERREVLFLRYSSTAELALLPILSVCLYPFVLAILCCDRLVVADFAYDRMGRLAFCARNICKLVCAPAVVLAAIDALIIVVPSARRTPKIFFTTTGTLLVVGGRRIRIVSHV